MSNPKTASNDLQKENEDDEGNSNEYGDGTQTKADKNEPIFTESSVERTTSQQLQEHISRDVPSIAETTSQNDFDPDRLQVQREKMGKMILYLI